MLPSTSLCLSLVAVLGVTVLRTDMAWCQVGKGPATKPEATVPEALKGSHGPPAKKGSAPPSQTKAKAVAGNPRPLLAAGSPQRLKSGAFPAADAASQAPRSSTATGMAARQKAKANHYARRPGGDKTPYPLESRTPEGKGMGRVERGGRPGDSRDHPAVKFTATHIRMEAAKVRVLTAPAGGMAVPARRIEDWEIQLERVRLSNREEDGDEPYFIVIQFRSRFLSPGSTNVTWNGELRELGDDLPRHAEVDIPAAVGRLTFQNVHRTTQADIRRGEMPEILGALVIAMESDNTPWDDIDRIVDDVRARLEEQIRILIENRNPFELALMSTEQRNELFRNVAAEVQEAARGTFSSRLQTFLDSWGDPDDLIDFHTFAFPAVDGLDLDLRTNDRRITAYALADRRFEIGVNPIVFEKRDDGDVEVRYNVTAAVRQTR